MNHIRKKSISLSSKKSVISMDNVSVEYEKDNVLKNISFSIKKGDSCSIMGHSGSGKSTLLNVIGLLQKPSSGDLYIEGKNTLKYSPTELAELRNKTIGFVFQSFHLLPAMKIIDNVALPLLYRGHSREKALFLAENALSNINLLDKAMQLPADLSGGQRQRIAIARALITKPKILLADEPTGNLDQSTAHEIIDFLLAIHYKNNMVMLVVTHDVKIANLMSRKFNIIDGKFNE